MTETERSRAEGGLEGLLEALGLDELPLGVCYRDEPPEDGISPRPQAPVSREAEERGEVDWVAVQENFACVLGVVWRARKKGTAAFFDRERFGCLGGGFYLGFIRPYLHMHPFFISTGIPGILEGERYAPTPEAAESFFKAVDPLPAPRRYCVIEPVDRFSEEDPPEAVVFFARPEAMSGLFYLVFFLTGDIDGVRTPFGPGCSYLVTWPLRYLAEGRRCAVMGGLDPSCRKFLKTDEMTFTVPWSLYREMLDRWPGSFLTTKTWETMRRKIARSRKAWGEGPR